MKKVINNKGFSMVELLAVVVILGVISTIGIAAVSKLVERSRNNYYLTQQKQMILATQAYVNDNRNILPKQIGSVATIKLQDLMDKKYITDKIVDQSKIPCDPEKSHVDIYKASTSDYKYVGYLECEACRKNKSDSTKCYDEKDRKTPVITIDIPDVSSTQSVNANSAISIDIKGSEDDANIKVSSYSYKIYVDGVLVKNSGLLVNNKESTLTINKEKIFNYVPGIIKVVVTATNTDGITKSKSSTKDLSDVLSPACGRITYENNNKLKDYDYVSPNNIKCGSTDYPWINIGQPSAIRQAWVLCNDEFKLGCAQHEFSTVLETDGEDQDVSIKDKKGNNQTCKIKKCIDKTTPKLTVRIKNKNTVKETFKVNGQRSTQVYNTSRTHNTWLNKANYPDGVTVEVIVEEATSKIKSFSWYQNAAGQKTPGATNSKVYVNNAIKDADYNDSGQFIKSQTITDDGVRKQVITVEDKAGNKTIYNLTLNIDRTAPKCVISGDGIWNPDGANIHTTCTETKTISNMNVCPHKNNHKVKNNVKYSISDVAGNSSSCTYNVEKATHYTKAACAAYNRSESLCNGCQTYFGCRRVAHGKETKYYNKNADHWFPFTDAGATKMDNFLVNGYIYLAGLFSDGTYNPNVTYTFQRNKDIDGSSIPSEGACGKKQKFNGTYNFREYDAITFSDMDKATCNESKVQAGNFYTFGRWNAGTCYLGTSSYYLACKTQSRKHHVDIETYKWQRSSACGCELAKACKEAGCATWSTTWSALSPTKPNCSDNSCKYKEVPVYK